MSDSVSKCFAVRCPNRGLLAWTCRDTALKAKVAFLEEYGSSTDESGWQSFAGRGFRLQPVVVAPAGDPFDGRADVTLAFERARRSQEPTSDR